MSNQTTTPAPLLLDVEGAARTLRISQQMVRKLEARGALEAIRIGRCVRFSAESLAHYVRSLEAKAAQAAA